MINTIQKLAHRHNHTTAYKFWKHTGIRRESAYKVYQNQNELPSTAAIVTICKAYGVQPGEFLVYVPETDAVSNES